MALSEPACCACVSSNWSVRERSTFSLPFCASRVCSIWSATTCRDTREGDHRQGKTVRAKLSKCAFSLLCLLDTTVPPPSGGTGTHS